MQSSGQEQCLWSTLWRDQWNVKKKITGSPCFHENGGKALHSPFVALNGHGAKLRNHDESFGFDKTGKWVHESAKDRVAYLKVTKRPPTYFSKTGALSLFYLDGRDADGKDISKTQTHVHGTKFTDKMMEKRIKKQVKLEQRYKQKTGISLGNNVAKYLDYNRKNTGVKLPKTMAVPVKKETNKPDPTAWIVFPSVEIEYIRNEAMSTRLKRLSMKNSIENDGFVDEIRHFDEKKTWRNLNICHTSTLTFLNPTIWTVQCRSL